MGTGRHVRWLYDQLPRLVAEGVLHEDGAARLRQHYGEWPKASGARVALTVCSIIGAVLVGAGTILLLAHNWTGLSRSLRTVLSLAPLVATQALGLGVLWTGRRSAAWRESTALGQTFAIGSSIALIGQTYHIPGDLGAFLLTWSLLALPAVYLFRSTGTALIYLAGITGWSGYAQASAGHALLFWPLFGALLPYLVGETRTRRESVAPVLLGWGSALCLCVATGITLEKALPGLWTIVYSALFAVFFLWGGGPDSSEDGILRRPFFTVGALGIVTLSLLLTFEFAWDDIGWSYYRHAARFHKTAAVADYVLTLGLFGAAMARLALAAQTRRVPDMLFGGMPAVAVSCYIAAALGRDAGLCVLLFNLYVFGLALTTIVDGIRHARAGTMNAGMGILSLLIIVRFFDSDMSFLVRGLVFIAVGIGFLGANAVVIRRMKRRQS